MQHEPDKAGPIGRPQAPPDEATMQSPPPPNPSGHEPPPPDPFVVDDHCPDCGEPEPECICQPET